MSYFAKVNDDNIVEQVIVAESAEWCETNIGGTWLQTSYNTVGGVHTAGGTPLRKNYAGIGYTYDSERDAFIAPNPYASWLLNEDTCLWESPVPKPADGKIYEWDESTLSWVEVTNE
jgi:hypothetical protein